MIVRDLLTRLGFQVDNSGLSKYEKGTERVKNNANAAAASFRNMFAAFAGIAAIKSIATIADSMQSLEARIGMLPQTVGEAGSAFERIAKKASEAKQSVNEYGSFYVKAGNATKSFIKTEEELLKVVDGAAYGLAASGSTAANQAQAFFQLGQAIGSPVVQMEEMNTLIDAGPELFAKLGEVIEGANGNLKKFIGTGKVTGKMLAKGLADSADYFQMKMGKIPLGIGQAMNIVGNEFAILVQRFNRETNIITKVANFLVTGMEMIGSGFKKFTEFVGGSENALKLLMITAGSFFAVWIAGWLKSAAVTLAATWPILAIIAALVLVGILFEDFLTWLEGGDSLLGDYIGSTEKWREEIDNVTDAFDGLMAVASYLWENGIKPMLGASWVAFTIGLKVVGAIFRSIMWTVSKIVDGIKSVAGFFGIGGELAPTGAVKPSAATMANVANQAMQKQENTFNITLPPGSPAATQEAARAGVSAAMAENPMFFTGQIGQAL